MKEIKLLFLTMKLVLLVIYVPLMRRCRNNIAHLLFEEILFFLREIPCEITS
jgi:hypothetical protein